MNTRHLECARASFNYQRKITPESVKGWYIPFLWMIGIYRLSGYHLSPNPTALLHRWYTLVREKRVTRQDFLKTLMRAFDLDPAELAVTQVCRIMFIAFIWLNVSSRTMLISFAT